MIVLRKKSKLFADIGDNSLGIGPGDIQRTGPRRQTDKYLGPWNILWSTDSFMEYNNASGYFTPQDIRTIDNIIDHIKVNPFFGKYNQHPLWEWEDSGNSNRDKRNRFVIWSANINKKDRLIYLIFKAQNTILIINCRDHKIGDEPYSENLLTNPNYQKKKRSQPKPPRLLHK